MVSKSNQVNTVSMEESRRAEIMKLVHAQIPAKDLKAKSRARVKRQLLTAKTKAARLERCKVLLSRLKKGAP